MGGCARGSRLLVAWGPSTWPRAGPAFALDSPFPPCSSTQPALSCKFFPRINDQSGHSQPSLLLWLNGEVAALFPSSLFMLRDNTLVTSDITSSPHAKHKNSHMAPPLEPSVHEAHILFHVLAGDAGRRTVPKFQPCPHNALAVGHFCKQCCRSRSASA